MHLRRGVVPSIFSWSDKDHDAPSDAENINSGLQDTVVDDDCYSNDSAVDQSIILLDNEHNGTQNLILEESCILEPNIDVYEEMVSIECEDNEESTSAKNEVQDAAEVKCTTTSQGNSHACSSKQTPGTHKKPRYSIEDIKIILILLRNLQD